MPSSRLTTCGLVMYGSIRSRDRDRTRARPAAAVRLRERLVQVEVHDVEPHVARPRAAHHGVEVRAVVVQRRAEAVDDLRDLLDVAIEHAERVRVRQHQAGDVVVGLRAQVVDVDAAVLVRADLDDLVAAHRHRRRVRPVRGVGREDLRAVIAAILVVGARQQHAGQLAVRARARLQRHVRQARDLGRAPPGARTSAPARPAPAWATAAGAAGRCRAAPRRARAASGCASSCTTRADRSRCRGRSCASTAGCSGGRSPARRSPAASAARRGGTAPAARACRRRAPAPRTRAGRARTSRRSSSRGRAACRSRGSRCAPDADRGLRCPDRREGGSR